MKNNRNNSESEPKKTRRNAFNSSPQSPWQVLVYDRCSQLRYSLRDLSDKVSLPRRKIYHSTLWAWMHNESGTPPPDAYTGDLNERLARALNLDPDTLARAYDESRIQFPGKISREVATESSKLTLLRNMISESRRDSWPRQELIDLIDQFAKI